MFIVLGYVVAIILVLYCLQLFDLGQPGYSSNSVAGCPPVEDLCARGDPPTRCWDRGVCSGTFSQAHCECLPGFSGHSCTRPTTPTTFLTQSYVKFALSFEPDVYQTDVQLRFRTREEAGELFRVSDQHARVYTVLEVRQYLTP